MDNQCYPCLVSAGLNAACLATEDQTLVGEIIRNVLAELAVADPKTPPPLIARFVQETVARVTGVDDPYGPLKKTCNDMALDLYPELLALKASAGNRRARFDTGVRLAIAGNIIDFGVSAHVGKKLVTDTISHSLKTSVHGSIETFYRAVDKAENILWLADNAGEIVFDRLLLEEMDLSKVIYAVRGKPVINDAVMEDARAAGLTSMVKVVDSGTNIPGTLVDYCSNAFKSVFHKADLIIVKGQGNFETLDHGDPRTWFLFKAKCSVVARYAGCNIGDLVVKQGGI
ncbi:MAG: DUF89 family protein [Desulfobacter sp.]|nr:DUF89 family protein [Desulfobacter sp.]